jgi:uncharacterized protein (TIGR02099 family)
MLHIAKIIHAKFWLLLAWLIILLALLSSLLKLWLPQLDLESYRQEIEGLVQQKTGLPLRIGSINAELLDANLALRFSDITLLDPQTKQPRVQFREAYIQIQLLRSVLNRQLILGEGVLIGGRLNLIRHLDGGVSINGFRHDGEQPLLDTRFLRRSKLALQDSEIHWHDLLNESAPLHFTQVDAKLYNRASRHQLTAVARLGLEGTERLRLMFDLTEAEGEPLRLSGRVYLQAEGLMIGGRRLAPQLLGGLQVERGRLDLELWGEIKQGRLQRLQAVAELDNLLLDAVHSPALDLDRIAGLFDWRRKSHGWQLDVDRLILLGNRQLWPPGRMSIAWQTDEAGRVGLQLGADYLELSKLTRLAAMLEPLGGELRQALLGLSPTGHLSRFRLALAQSDKRTNWQVQGSVSQYHHQPWRLIPGVSGLNLAFQGDQGGGRLRLGSKGFTANIPQLFREPLSATRLNGNFVWNLDPETGIRLKTTDLSMINDHLQTLSRMDVRVPWGGENPFLDMQTDFWEGDGAYKSRYLPVGIMPQPLVDWLDRALVSGHIKAGSMLLYGPLRAFPFKNHEGRFEVLFGIEEMVLDYMPGWPRLEEVVAEAHFLNNSLAIKLFEGNLLASKIGRADARIRSLNPASPVEIIGTVEGPFGDLLRVLHETPLKQRFARFTSAVEGSGEIRTGLDLHIPLKRSDAGRIRGGIEFLLAKLVIKDHDLALQALNGQLQFDEEKVWGKDLEARLLSQPVILQIEPLVHDAERKTRITTALVAEAAWLRQRFPGLLDFLQGQAAVDVVLSIAHAQSRVPLSLSLVSTLQGMAIELPEPLGKTLQEARALDLAIDFIDQQQHDLKLSYAAGVNVWLRETAGELLGVDLRLGGASAQRPDAAAIRLQGETATLDLDRWIAWLNNQARVAEGRQALSLYTELQAEQLKLVGMRFPKVTLQGYPVRDAWELNFRSEHLAGQVKIPRDLAQRPILIQLERLKLTSAELTADTQPDASSEVMDEIDPRRLPALELLLDELWIDGKSFGQVQLRWEKSPLGIELKTLSLKGQEVELQGTGHWHKVGDKQFTELALTGSIQSLGQLQQDLGLQMGISKAPMDFEGLFSWPLPPPKLRFERLSGQLNLQVGAGEVTDVDPGVGRLVGLLSLHALEKRLSLDFSDLYAKGLEFDSITGNFTLENGNASTNNLILTSPATQVLISGRTGLAAQDYDQLVTVIPRVSSALPLVGALAVNPTVGVVLAVTQQLLGNQVDRVIQNQYRLTGSWQDPSMVKLKLDADPDHQAVMMPDLPGQD